jgi:hypothetical protein
MDTLTDNLVSEATVLEVTKTDSGYRVYLEGKELRNVTRFEFKIDAANSSVPMCSMDYFL